MRILIITAALPYPPISGNPLRVYNLLRRMTEEYEVWLVTFVRGSAAAESLSHLQEFCHGVEAVEYQQLGALVRPFDFFRYLLTGKPPDLRLYYSEELVSKIQHLVSKIDFDIVEIVDSYMAMYLQALPQEMRSKTILTFIDVVFSKYDRIYQLEPKRARKLRLWLHSRIMRRWEPRYAESFDHCITVSETDRRLLVTINPRLQIDVVPNGVDTHAYQPLPCDDIVPTLVFVGNMNYRPNIDGVLWFCHELLPYIRRKVPEVEMWIVGIDPQPEVKQLNGDSVHVTGRVDDVRPYYGKSTVCVVPLRAGGGTRLKILEAMALGRPVVSTSIGCEGLNVIDGEHILIADTPKQFTEKTVRLLKNEGLRNRIATKARQLVVDHYDWDMITKKLMRIYAEMIE